MSIPKTFTSIKNRFKKAKLSISDFNNIDDIEIKILNDSDEYIIYKDSYNINSYNEKPKNKRRWLLLDMAVVLASTTNSGVIRFSGAEC